MEIKEKYSKVRAALVQIVGVEDSVPALSELRDAVSAEARQLGADEDDVAAMTGALTALIETHN